MSDEYKQFCAALAKAQGECRTVGKDGYNQYSKYNYSTAENMIRAARGPLAENGLAFYYSWRVEGRTVPENASGQYTVGIVHIDWRLAHAGGHCEQDSCAMAAIGSVKRPDDKAVAATLTYAHGFVLRGLLGLDRDEEDPDGVDQRQETQSQRPAEPPPLTEEQKQAKFIAEATRVLVREIGVKNKADVELLMDWLGLDESITTDTIKTEWKHAADLLQSIAGTSASIEYSRMLDEARRAKQTEEAVDESFPAHAEKTLMPQTNEYPGA